MKNLIILLTSIIVSGHCFSQTGTWETINISSWGQIKLPPSMEVQSGTYKKILDELKKEFSVNADRIVFQQKGLNSFGNFDTYARVIIRTEHVNPGDFPKLNDLTISDSELNELNSTYKEQVLSVCKSMNAQLLKWTNMEVSILNGVKCLYCNYTRQIIDKPSTFSEFYIFFNDDKQHSLNIEYRLADASSWKPELEKCKSTFKFK